MTDWTATLLPGTSALRGGLEPMGSRKRQQQASLVRRALREAPDTVRKGDLEALYPRERDWLKHHGAEGWRQRWEAERAKVTEEAQVRFQQTGLTTVDVAPQQGVKRRQMEVADLKEKLRGLVERYEEYLTGDDASLSNVDTHGAALLQMLEVAKTFHEVRSVWRDIREAYGMKQQTINVKAQRATIEESEKEIEERILRLSGARMRIVEAG